MTELDNAIESRDLDAVYRALARGCHAINSFPPFGYMPYLHQAASDGLYDISLALIADGADVKLNHPRHGTPLHVNASYKLVAELCQRSANVNAKNRHGDAPLHCALRRKLDRVALELISNGADINLPGAASATPLTLALQNQIDSEVVYAIRVPVFWSRQTHLKIAGARETAITLMLVIKRLGKHLPMEMIQRILWHMTTRDFVSPHKLMDARTLLRKRYQ